MHDSQSIQNLKSEVQNNRLRILLWDIDGTLTTSTRAGSYKKYFAAAMEKVYGSYGSLNEMSVSGMTDTQIMYEALRDEGFTPEKIFAEKEKLLEVFREEMSRVVSADENHFRILEGVREILTETDKNPRFINALLTGNLSVAAEIKLRYVDLWHFFEGKPNLFGEISHDRRELAKAAGKLFKEFYKTEFEPEQFIVIGDTPNDIACARAFGAKVIAVASGRNQSAENLLSYNPDAFFEDLADTSKVLHLLEVI